MVKSIQKRSVFPSEDILDWIPNVFSMVNIQWTYGDLTSLTVGISTSWTCWTWGFSYGFIALIITNYMGCLTLSEVFFHNLTYCETDFLRKKHNMDTETWGPVGCFSKMDMGDGCEIRFSTKRIVDSLFEEDKPLINEGFRWPIHSMAIYRWGIHLCPLESKMAMDLSKESGRGPEVLVQAWSWMQKTWGIALFF